MWCVYFFFFFWGGGGGGGGVELLGFRSLGGLGVWQFVGLGVFFRGLGVKRFGSLVVSGV